MILEHRPPGTAVLVSGHGPAGRLMVTGLTEARAPVTNNRGDGGNGGGFRSMGAASSTRITEALAAEARASVTSHRIGGGNGGGFHSREATASNAGDGFHCQQQAR